MKNLSQYISHLLSEKRYSQHTASAYQNDIEQFGFYLKSVYEIVDEADVSFPIVRSFVVSLMEEDYNPRSVNRKISSLKSYFKFLRTLEVIKVNPASRLQAVKTAKHLVKTVAADEMISLFQAEGIFADDLNGLRARAIIEMLYSTGIRRNELITLKLSDVDFSAHTIKVVGKRKKSRLIPFPKSLESVLKKYIELQPRTNESKNLFFLTNRGKKIYPKLVYDTVNGYLSLVSTIDKKSPHILRHSYATHLLNKGADVNDIKELLGHASLSATQVYTHNSFEKLKKEYNQTHPREHKNR